MGKFSAPSREPSIDLNTAHDVRKLRVCSHCQSLGDSRYMVTVNGKLVHGFCALDLIGIKGLLSLPHREQDKLTIGEIGSRAMKRLVEARVKSKTKGRRP